MGFYASNFVFNGISSESYNIQIVNFDSGGVKQSVLGGGSKPIFTQIRRRHNTWLFGSQPAEPLEFELTFASETEMDSYELSAVSKWLFGKQDYGWLQIEQPSYEGIWFRCMLLEPELVNFSGYNIGIKCKVSCNSSYAYTDEYTYNYTLNGTQTINFNNFSDSDLYVYPTVQFVTSNLSTSFSMTNQSDGNRVFSFTGLNTNETVTVDNDKQIITSSTGLNRLSKFNLNFFRLVPNYNTLLVSGNGTFSLTLRFLKKVGG